MIRFPFLLAALLALPTLSGAEEVWRWRDADGRLNYTNIADKAPSDAEPVRTQLGRASTAIAPEDAAKVRADLENYRELRRARRERARESGRPHRMSASPYAVSDCCAPFGMQHLLTTTGRSLADQVQEASLLDALNVRWRTPTCQ